jgi:hypothetical protein
MEFLWYEIFGYRPVWLTICKRYHMFGLLFSEQFLQKEILGKKDKILVTL